MSLDTNEFQDLRAAIERFRQEHGEHLRFPDEIKTPALQVAKDLGVTKAGELLGISHSALFRWKKESTVAKSKPKTKRIKFVELERAPTSAKPVPGGAITITTPAGVVVSLSADLPPDYVAAVIAAGGGH